MTETITETIVEGATVAPPAALAERIKAHTPTDREVVYVTKAHPDNPYSPRHVHEVSRVWVTADGTVSAGPLNTSGPCCRVAEVAQIVVPSMESHTRWLDILSGREVVRVWGHSALMYTDGTPAPVERRYVALDPPTLPAVGTRVRTGLRYGARSGSPRAANHASEETTVASVDRTDYTILPAPDGPNGWFYSWEVLTEAEPAPVEATAWIDDATPEPAPAPVEATPEVGSKVIATNLTSVDPERKALGTLTYSTDSGLYRVRVDEWIESGTESGHQIGREWAFAEVKPVESQPIQVGQYVEATGITAIDADVVARGEVIELRGTRFHVRVDEWVRSDRDRATSDWTFDSAQVIDRPAQAPAPAYEPAAGDPVKAYGLVGVDQDAVAIGRFQSGNALGTEFRVNVDEWAVEPANRSFTTGTWWTFDRVEPYTPGEDVGIPTPQTDQDPAVAEYETVKRTFDEKIGRLGYESALRGGEYLEEYKDTLETLGVEAPLIIAKADVVVEFTTTNPLPNGDLRRQTTERILIGCEDTRALGSIRMLSSTARMRLHLPVEVCAKPWQLERDNGGSLLTQERVERALRRALPSADPTDVAYTYITVREFVGIGSALHPNYVGDE